MGIKVSTVKEKQPANRHFLGKSRVKINGDIIVNSFSEAKKSLSQLGIPNCTSLFL